MEVTSGYCCPGGDSLGVVPASSTAECCQKCQAFNGTSRLPTGHGCAVFTFNVEQNMCYLKGSAPGSSPGNCDCGHYGPLPPPSKPRPPPSPPLTCSWAPRPGVGCARRGGAGAGGWQVPARDSDDCCAICSQGRSGPGHPKCGAWTYLPYSYHPNGACLMSSTPDCQVVDSPTGGGAVGGCDPGDPSCKPPPAPGPITCRPVERPPPPKLTPLPPGIEKPPHIVTLLIDDLGFDDLRSHDLKPGAPSFSPTIEALVKDGVLLNRHHTYMWCSPTRRSFITGRYLVHITGEQAATNTNLTPLQYTLLSEKLRAANYENHFLGKGHLGWQTTDHLLVNRGFKSHMGYLGGSESYKWGRMDKSLDPSPLTGAHDMWHDDHPGTDIAPLIGYSTSFYAMEAVDLINSHDAAKNFWLHVAFQAVHGGAHQTETDACDLLPRAEDNHTAANGYRNAGYGSMLRSLDHAVSNITAALKASGMWGNTILWLSADNGGDNPVGAASNYPLVGRKCLAWEGGTRTFAFVAGGLIPESQRGTTNDQLMHVSDWYVTFSTMAGVDPDDYWTDPVTGLVHTVDGINQWPSIVGGSTSPRTLPTTHKSLLIDDGKGHMYKLINGNETRADRFHANGTVYEDPYNECLPGHGNVTFGIQFDCINALGQDGGGGRVSCVVCSDDEPCLFDVIADPGETKNLAASMPGLAERMKTTLNGFLPYVPALTAENLACYNCSFDASAKWQGYPGPPCIAK